MGSQFISTRFEAFCEKWKIQLTKSTPRYPQCNGQAETINKTVLDGLKKRLEDRKGRWAEELEGVLWSHRTTPRWATGETPFSLVYRTECMIPAEVEFPEVRRRFLLEREDLNNAMMLDELNLVNSNEIRRSYGSKITNTLPQNTTTQTFAIAGSKKAICFCAKSSKTLPNVTQENWEQTGKVHTRS
ncbi:hypothetical protein Bca4012_026670 [Brassica carinata]